ncbi:TetR family transcriptional regulator [Amycolatopsis vancoresmycina DSM 44592]|uniref:TetR family transcriptional regulator n=1 Tax=Amycolatopsis vancoresmycina DSM 44592 TaxID=1292037 RepID=R1I981_9PSEU|nr:TetR family transcriptional regulator [Amycolatopsis vancoresmycina DSM 44592]
MPHLRRSDARDNRERILEAARAVFAADGLTVPMRRIARHAGVGPATLYRHFPTKEALATAAFAGRMRACYAIVDDGLADPDPGRGFTSTVERLCELHARDRGFTAAFTAEFPHALDFGADRSRALKAIAELTRRARAAGHLRPDVQASDVILVLLANGGLPAASPAESRRFAVLALRGLQA